MNAHRPEIDNAIEIVTPENIAFRYQVAGPFRRLPAYLIDLVIRAVMFFLGSLLIAITFGAIGLFGEILALTLILWFLLDWFYGGVFETFWNGQTPGKRLLQIRVLSVDGQPINGLQAVLRNVLRLVDLQPGMFSLVGLAAATMNDRFQRMGDLACGTMVVVDEPRWFHGVIRLNDPGTIRLAGRIPPSYQASPTTVRALATYVQRRMNFAPMRRLEIARHLAEPLRQKFDLPPGTDPDLLLCALYQRTFIKDWEEEPEIRAGSPFWEGGSPFASSVEAISMAEVAETAADPAQRPWPAEERSS